MRAPDYSRIFPHRSLRARALWVFLPLALLPLSALGVYSQMMARKATLRVQLQGIRSHAEDLAGDIDHYLSERGRNVVLIAHPPAIRSFSDASSEECPAFRSHALADLTSFLEINPHHEAAYLLDRSGGSSFSTIEDPDTHAASRSYFLRALAGETYASAPPLLGSSKRAVICVSTPVFHLERREITGVAVWRVWARGVLGRSCQEFLGHCDEEGRVLCDTKCPISQVLRQGQPVSLSQVWVHSSHPREEKKRAEN